MPEDNIFSILCRLIKNPTNLTGSQKLCQQINIQALEVFCFTQVFGFVLILSVMELTFPIADFIVLYFVPLTRTVLTTHQCFGHC